MNLSRRYLALVLIGFMPSLSGCLNDFFLRGGIGQEQPRDEVESQTKEEEPSVDRSKDLI